MHIMTHFIDSALSYSRLIVPSPYCLQNPPVFIPPSYEHIFDAAHLFVYGIEVVSLILLVIGFRRRNPEKDKTRRIILLVSIVLLAAFFSIRFAHDFDCYKFRQDFKRVRTSV